MSTEAIYTLAGLAVVFGLPSAGLAGLLRQPKAEGGRGLGFAYGVGFAWFLVVAVFGAGYLILVSGLSGAEGVRTRSTGEMVGLLVLQAFAIYLLAGVPLGIAYAVKAFRS